MSSPLSDLFPAGDAAAGRARLLAIALGHSALFAHQHTVLTSTPVLAGGDLLWIAPTGVGKSVAAEAALCRTLGRGAAAVWLVSTRALAREITDRLARAIGPLGYRVALSTRDQRADDEAIRLGTIDVVVTVYEKALSLFAAGGRWRERVGLLIADEAQLLLDADRGPLARLLLARWRSQHHRPQLVALSAALDEAAALEGYLSLEAVVTEQRPVPLQVGEMDLARGIARWSPPGQPPREEDLPFRISRSEELVDRLGELLATVEKPALVFWPTRREALAAARQLADASPQQIRLPLPDEVARGPVGWLLARGIGVHTTEQTRAERHAVESALRDGRLDVCCCTTTLAEGLNVSARTVLYVQGLGEPTWRRDNCLGRAGRPGAAWVLIRPGDDARWTHRSTAADPVNPAVQAIAFLLRDGVPVVDLAAELHAAAIDEMAARGAWDRGLRAGLWSAEGELSPSGELAAVGGVDAESAAAWRTMLRRFPAGGGEVATLFLALGASPRAVEGLSLSQEERQTACWIGALVEELRRDPSDLSRYLLDFLEDEETLPRRHHQAAKGVLMVRAWLAGERPHALADKFRVAAGLAEDFVEHARFLAAQLARLARTLGTPLTVADPLAATPPPTPPAAVIPVAAAAGAPRPRLIIHRGSAGMIDFDGHRLHLTPLQFRLLELLARYPGEGLAYGRIEAYVWPDAVVERQQISYHRSRLVKRLQELAATRETLIGTISCWGLRLELDRSEVAIVEDHGALHGAVLRDWEEGLDQQAIPWSVSL